MLPPTMIAPFVLAPVVKPQAVVASGWGSSPGAPPRGYCRFNAGRHGLELAGELIGGRGVSASDLVEIAWWTRGLARVYYRIG
jgi:hypothetical protein